MATHEEAAAELVADIKATTTPQKLALAQVYATLALAYEQRLANEIETLRLGTSALDEADLEKVKTPASVVRQSRVNELRARIKKGLRLS